MNRNAIRKEKTLESTSGIARICKVFKAKHEKKSCHLLAIWFRLFSTLLTGQHNPEDAPRLPPRIIKVHVYDAWGAGDHAHERSAANWRPTVYRAPLAVHRTPCTAHRTPYTVHRTTHTEQHTPYAVHRTYHTQNKKRRGAPPVRPGLYQV